MGGFNPNPLFGGNTPLMNQPVSPNPFMKNAPMSNEEIDRMIADIDKKLKELDEEEAKQKELEKQTTKKEPVEQKEEVHSKEKKSAKTNETKKEKKELSEKKISDKPKINVDVDSVIVKNNIITDDEFFDDFFTDE